MYYYLVTLGCQMNISDSERISAVIEQLGYSRTDNEKNADLLGIVACSVRQKAINKVYTRIHKWNTRKNSRNLVTFITGCILPSDRNKFLKLFDLIFQISELPQLHEMLNTYGVVTPFALSIRPELLFANRNEMLEPVEFNTLFFDNNKKSISGQPVLMKAPETRISEFWHIEPHYQSAFEAYIPIQNGCDKFCTFCAVPYTRGREISRPGSEVLAEMKLLVDSGYKSITLLGQNVNSYGNDKKGGEMNFATLLENIGRYGEESGKEFLVYFTSPHPHNMDDEVFRVMSKYKCLAKQIHLPLQSGSNTILKRMNRNYTLSDYRKIMGSIKKYLPEATLFTDIIVGFTGETEEQFRETFDAMEEFAFNMAYIACYSPRPGAVSARWDDDIPQSIKKKRLHTLSVLLQKHSLQHNRSMIGKTYKVLVTGHDRKAGYWSGLTEGRIIVRFSSDNTNLSGNFMDIEITSAAEFSIEGKMATMQPEKITET